jgi:hypothetical protein
MLRRFLLSTLLVASAAFTAPVARAAEIDNLLPAQTESVLFVNIKQFLEADLIKKYALGQVTQMLESNEEAQKLLKDLGIDPLKDLDRVTAGFWGKDAEDVNGVAIIRGKFDLEKLFAAAEREAKNNGDKMAIVKEGDYKLVKFTPENQPKPIFASAADENTIIAGTDKKLVAATLTAAKEKAKPAISKELSAMLLKADEKATMYIVGKSNGEKVELPPNVNIPGVDGEKLAKQLQQLDNYNMTIRLTGDISLEMTMGMKDADSADDFGDTLNQLIGTVKGFLPLIAGQQPNFKPLADEIGKTLKSKVTGKDVTVNLKLSGTTISQAAGGIGD